MPSPRHRSVLRGILVASVALGSSPAQDESVGRARVEPGETVGVPWTGGRGVRESVADLMEREARAPKIRAFPRLREEPEGRPGPIRENPAAPPVSQWPPPSQTQPLTSEAVTPLAPQVVGTNFKAISLNSPNESMFIPPDSVGDVGPTQILAMANGRIKVFDKTGSLGGLNVTDGVFFASVTGGSDITDPQVRYDRLSQRWFITMIDVASDNKILIAVSSGPTITSSSSFTFFAFQHDLVGTTPNSDTGGFADYDSLGVDRSALYIGVNVFNAAGTVYLGSTGYGNNKAGLLAGTLTVTAFRRIASAAIAGPWSPRGVDNDDPAATQGFFIGVDTILFSQIDILRVSNPGGTPSISGNIVLTVPATTLPIPQAVKGSASNRRLDALDDRLFAASIHKNKITGATSLWTAHNFEVNSSGVVSTHGTRNGSRWYEFTNLGGTPSLNQAGTLFDTVSTNPRGFWIDTVAASGQGHMALGSSYASTKDFAGVATAGRLRTDALGTIKVPSLAQISASAYNQQSVDGQRWGDYSHTVVDPTDDMTLWTFQEWCDATNSWGVQVVQLKAPPPASPTGAVPSSICAGQATVDVTIAGASSAGSEFFDPGADAGGPGYPNHLSATVSGGVGVNGVTFADPTHVALSLSTVGAAPGVHDITLTNPDGQSSTGVGLLTVNGASSPAASHNGPICPGATLQLSAGTVAGATYSWTGPNGFASSAQNPSIPGATTAASGTYRVSVTLGGCTSDASVTTAAVIGDGSACNDGNPCTQADTCQAGVCSGGGVLDADGDGHRGSLCGGDDCNDNNPFVWSAPVAVTNLSVAGADPTGLAWDSQGVLVGLETVYDLVSGEVLSSRSVIFSSAACVLEGGGTSFPDTRPAPPAGQAYWYLARGENSCGAGTYGTSQQDTAILACS